MADSRRSQRGDSEKTPQQVVQEIAETGSGPFLLLGENGVDREEAVDAVIGSVTAPETQAFNFDDLDSSDREITTHAVASAVRSLPMLADTRLVLVRNLEECRDEIGEVLASLLEEPMDGTVLLMSGEKLDGRKKWAQKLSAAATKFTFDLPRGRSFNAWLRRQASRHGATMSNDAAEMLQDYVGQDVWRGASEAEKLALFVLPRTEIEIEDVEAAVGLTREDTVFTLNDRIAEMKAGSALGIAERMAQSGQHPAYIVGMIVRHWQALRLTSDLVSNRREQELNKMLGENRQWILRKYVTQARTLRRERIRSGFRLAVTAESAIKAGWEPKVVLDGLICQLAAPPRS